MKLPLLEGWRGQILQPITAECSCPALSSLPRAQRAPKPTSSQRYSPAPLMSPLRSRYYKQPPDEFCQIEGTGTAAQTLIICVNRVNLLSDPQQHSWEGLAVPGRAPRAVFVGQLCPGCLQRMSSPPLLFASPFRDPGDARQGEERLLCFPGVHGQGKGERTVLCRARAAAAAGRAPGCSSHPLPSLLSQKPLRAAATQAKK